MDARVRRHETIHFQQVLETLFFGFVLIYFWDYFLSRLRGYGGEASYVRIRAELEAYGNEGEELYLLNRRRWAWLSLSAR